MAETASISTGIAERYATAVFELARDEGILGAIESDIDTLDSALAGSADFRDLISSPVHGREETGAAIAALAERMELSQVMTNTLALMAEKRRLFVLPQMTRLLGEQIAAEKGEVTAEVTAARALSAAQETSLASTLKASAGKDVKLRTAVDESLIGGMVVKLGSRMIDTSIRSRLGALKNSMKEVG